MTAPAVPLQPPRATVSLSYAASRLGTAPRTLRRAIEAGAVSFAVIRIGDRILIAKAELERVLAAHDAA